MAGTVVIRLHTVSWPIAMTVHRHPADMTTWLALILGQVRTNLNAPTIHVRRDTARPSRTTVNASNES
jgi:hypothetical protein